LQQRTAHRKHSPSPLDLRDLSKELISADGIVLQRNGVASREQMTISKSFDHAMNEEPPLAAEGYNIAHFSFIAIAGLDQDLVTWTKCWQHARALNPDSG